MRDRQSGDAEAKLRAALAESNVPGSNAFYILKGAKAEADHAVKTGRARHNPGFDAAASEVQERLATTERSPWHHRYRWGLGDTPTGMPVAGETRWNSQDLDPRAGKALPRPAREPNTDILTQCDVTTGCWDLDVYKESYEKRVRRLHHEGTLTATRPPSWEGAGVAPRLPAEAKDWARAVHANSLYDPPLDRRVPPLGISGNSTHYYQDHNGAGPVKQPVNSSGWLLPRRMTLTFMDPHARTHSIEVEPETTTVSQVFEKIEAILAGEPHCHPRFLYQADPLTRSKATLAKAGVTNDADFIVLY